MLICINVNKHIYVYTIHTGLMHMHTFASLSALLLTLGVMLLDGGTVDVPVAELETEDVIVIEAVGLRKGRERGHM